MSNRNLKHSLRSTLASLALASSLTGVVAACSADTPTVTQVPSTIRAKFLNGEFKALEVTYDMETEAEWDRFLRFMERFSAANQMGMA